jgi:hypothetical protein
MTLKQAIKIIARIIYVLQTIFSKFAREIMRFFLFVSVAELLSPPTRDAPRLQQIVKSSRSVKTSSASLPQRPKIRTTREATVHSPEEALFKASLPRRLVPSVKVARKTPSPPLRKKKSGQT